MLLFERLVVSHAIFHKELSRHGTSCESGERHFWRLLSLLSFVTSSDTGLIFGGQVRLMGCLYGTGNFGGLVIILLSCSDKGS